MNDSPKDRNVTIWKYPLLDVPVLVHKMPMGAKPVHIGPDAEGRFSVWCMVDPQQPLEDRQIVTVSSGEGIPESAAKDYVGTFSYAHGVNHIFVLTAQAN